ncbi:MAG TPA: quinoprotein dehydrogenase-associated putative ABC transporter substrate-binding protein [Steroidobacteraceae bacterium]|jgi:mxaJ protein
MKRSAVRPLRGVALLVAAAALGASMAAIAAGAGDAGVAPAGSGTDAAAGTLVVCADPNNLPFSNRAGQGFENKLAELLAHDMGEHVEYVWWAQRRGYVRSTLNEARCDLWPGVATGVDRVSTSKPYYRSTYVFVTRRDRRITGLSLDDPRLHTLSIGVQMIGNNATNTPPAHALAHRGITDNVHGYMLYGVYDHPNPSAAIVAAVEHGDVDVALVWGPLAGYFAGRSRVPLRLEPVTPSFDGPQLPMVYSISVGVRRGNAALRTRVDQILEREKPKVDALLASYHVPQAPPAAGSSP